VAEKISDEVSKNSFSGDKKGAKLAEKTRQMVSFYDVETGSKQKTVAEFYEIIYRLRFSPDGAFVIVSQTPEISTQVASKKISYFNLIDAATAEPVRRGFTSMSVNQPAIHFSSDRKYFSINSKGQKFQEIHLYDSETGTLQKRFELGKRIFEKVDGEKLFSDSRPSFAFLPGDESILIAMGNQFLVWNLK
jgi:WD40 repeat protein